MEGCYKTWKSGKFVNVRECNFCLGNQGKSGKNLIRIKMPGEKGALPKKIISSFKIGDSNK